MYCQSKLLGTRLQVLNITTFISVLRVVAIVSDRKCSELASNVVETTYVHVDANTVWRPDNYYWVVACSGDGCSEVDSENPAQPD